MRDGCHAKRGKSTNCGGCRTTDPAGWLSVSAESPVTAASRSARWRSSLRVIVSRAILLALVIYHQVIMVRRLALGKLIDLATDEGWSNCWSRPGLGRTLRLGLAEAGGRSCHPQARREAGFA